MRNPKRIRPFLKELGDIWERVPDWRFGQLIVNFIGSLNRDPFFYEDDELLSKLKEYFNES